MRLWCALLVAAPAAHANPLELFGFTPRGAAMAGAHGPVADDLSAPFYNPAALLGREKRELGLGLAAHLPALRIDRRLPGSPVESARPEGGARLEAAAIVPVGGAFRGHLYFGAAIGVPVDKLLRIENLDPARPQFVLYQSKPQRFSITIDAALRLAPGLALGVGLQIAQQQSGFYRFGLDVAERRVTVREAHVDARISPAPVLGLVYELPGSWRLGFTWRGEQSQRTEVPTVFDLGPLGALQIETTSTSFYWPHTLAIAASVRPGPLFVAATIEAQLWSRAPSDEVQFAILPTGEVLTNLGFSGLLGFSAPARPAALRSVIVLRVGGEVRAWPRVALRAGVSVKPAITPEQSSGTSYLDSLGATLAAGAGVELLSLDGAPLFLDASLAVSLLANREMRKAAPGDATGGADFGGAIWAMSAMIRYAY